MQREKVKLKLKTLPALSWALSNSCLNVTGNPLHKKVKGLIVNFYLKFSCSFRKTFCLSLIFVFNNNIVFCLLSQIMRYVI